MIYRFTSVAAAILLPLALFLGQASARPLTEEDIRGAKKIAIMPGTFDPITLGHLGAAEAVVQQGAADMVIFAISENPKKNPLSREVRLKMAALGAKDSKTVYIAEPGSPLYPVFRDATLFGISKKVKELNPSAHIGIVVGSDIGSNQITGVLFQTSVRPDEWIIVNRKGYENEPLKGVPAWMPHQRINIDLPDVSSSGTKKYILAHPELFHASAEGAKPDPIPGVDPKVSDYIVANHLYEQPEPPAPKSLIACYLRSMTRVLFPPK
jgi:cytidyltransferase-like protein